MVRARRKEIETARLTETNLEKEMGKLMETRTEKLTAINWETMKPMATVRD